MDLSCSECDAISLYFMCYSVNGSACLVCCVFVNCLSKQCFGCGCYFVVECYGGVQCGWRCSVFGILCSSPIMIIFVILLAVCESGLCVFCKLCPVCFLVVGKGRQICCSL